jgi:hypothetical protein
MPPRSSRCSGTSPGYDHQADKVFLYRSEPRTVTYTAHVPPETRACMFWLRNRRPEDWRAKAEPMPEVFADDIALLDAAGEGMRHAGD